MNQVRIDDIIHKRLKIEAVHRDTTVQNLVEQLILSNLEKSQVKDVG